MENIKIIPCVQVKPHKILVPVFLYYRADFIDVQPTIVCFRNAFNVGWKAFVSVEIVLFKNRL